MKQYFLKSLVILFLCVFGVGISSSAFAQAAGFHNYYADNPKAHASGASIRPPKAIANQASNLTSSPLNSTGNAPVSAGNMVASWIRPFTVLAYMIAGIGAFSLGILGFYNRMSWRWFLMMTGGLFILATYDFFSGSTKDVVGTGWLNIDQHDPNLGSTEPGAGSYATEYTSIWGQLLWRMSYASTEYELFIYTVAGIAVFAMGLLCYFGKFQWKWFFTLTGALFLVSGFQTFINFVSAASPKGQMADNTFMRGNSYMATFSYFAEMFTYIVAGLGAMTLAILAFFGKFSWKYVAALAGGLLVVGGFQAIIDFAVPFWGNPTGGGSQASQVDPSTTDKNGARINSDPASLPAMKDYKNTMDANGLTGRIILNGNQNAQDNSGGLPYDSVAPTAPH